MIGGIRVSCHGNHRFEVIMRAVAKSELKRVLQWEPGVDHAGRGRDNAGGTKLGSHAAPASMNVISPFLPVRCGRDWSRRGRPVSRCISVNPLFPFRGFRTKKRNLSCIPAKQCSQPWNSGTNHPIIITGLLDKSRKSDAR